MKGAAWQDRRVLVFLGPSLDRTTALEILPDAVFLPPIRQGDLLSAVDRYQPDVVAIVDGEFNQSLSVWHKEILHVLGTGQRVFGASSMGALRAAECDVYGMEGVGRIYQWFRDGDLTDDDEVALLHLDSEREWRALTWPMVNVRTTVEALRGEGAVDTAAADAVLVAAKSLYFGGRSRAAIAAQLVADGRPDGPELAALVAEHYVDQKRLDAEQLLRHLAIGPGPAPVVQREPRERLGWLGQTLRVCDTDVVRATGVVERRRIVHDAALHEPDFEALHERALNRVLVATYAQELGYDPAPEDLVEERARFLARRDLTEEELPDWLANNDLDEEDFRVLITDEARARRLRRWLLGLLGYEHTCGPVTDQLRLEGDYPDVADRAARRAELAGDGTPELPGSPDDVQRLVAEHIGATGWRVPANFGEWIEEYGFESSAEWLLALGLASAARHEGARRSGRARDVLSGFLGGVGA